VAEVAGRDASETGPETDGSRTVEGTAMPEPETVGGALRQAREAAGLSLEDVAARTKVRPGILAAIEGDRHDDLPALAYTTGFVKAFARTVGLDPQAMAERYRTESRKGEPAPSIIDLEPLDEKRVPSRGLVVAMATLLLVGLGILWAWGAGLFDPATPPPPRVAERMDAPDAPEAIAEPETGAAPVAGDAPVTLRAREEAWVRIDNRDTGSRFFEGTLSQGQELPLPPGEPLQLRTGRAGAIEISIGSEILPPLGGPVEQVRNVSLLPADLLQRSAATAGDGPGAPPSPGLPDAPRPPGA
jgi:cytoskeleton protein RodZ